MDVKRRLWLLRLGVPLAAVAIASTAAQADFVADARRTLSTDVPHFFQTDVPHFFQEDIPCAFRGKPTSHTRTSCPGRRRAERHSAHRTALPRPALTPSHGAPETPAAAEATPPVIDATPPPIVDAPHAEDAPSALGAAIGAAVGARLAVALRETPLDRDRASSPDQIVTTYVSPTRRPKAARVENRRVAIAACGGDGFVLIGEATGRDARGQWFRLNYGCLAKDEAEVARPSTQASTP